MSRRPTSLSRCPFVWLLPCLLMLFAACNRLEYDADRMARKTCECISFTADSVIPADAEKCFNELMQLASSLESQYPSEEQQQQLIDRYTKTLRDCDAPTTDLMIDYLSGEWSNNQKTNQDEIPVEDEK